MTRHLDAPTTLPWDPTLAGIRGLAIAIVVACHIGAIPSGGLVGVTLFFVLSGYLIGSLLLGEHARTGTIDLAAFLARRTWRLLPALVVVVIAVTAVGAIGDRLWWVAQDSSLTLMYVANWARAGGDPMGWWNHAWSLSIEEQFYVLAPVALVTLVRWRGASGRSLITALAIGVVVVMVTRGALVAGGASADRVYFGTDTRADALLLGGLLAALKMYIPRWTPAPWVGPLGLVVVMALAVAPVVDRWILGSGYAVTALASMAVVAGSGGRPASPLAARPLVWLGERSYSLYLVHVPVLLFVDGALAAAAPAVRVSTGVVLSVVLAVALFRYVERPLRRRSRGITPERARGDAGQAPIAAGPVAREVPA